MRDDLAAVLKRNIHFMQDEIKSGVLLHVTGINLRPLPEVKALEQWNFPDDWQAYMDACIERETAYWEQRRGIDDDRLPTMKPFYGIAEHSAFVGGEVVYGGNTSYHMHPVKDWSDLDTLVCDENNENFKMLIDSIRYLKKGAEKSDFWHHCGDWMRLWIWRMQ